VLRLPAHRAGLPSVLSSQGFLEHHGTPLVGSLADGSMRANDAMYDGVTTRRDAALSISSGRGSLTRFRRCWRYGAAIGVSLQWLER
jgi:hypothetical protein